VVNSTGDENLQNDYVPNRGVLAFFKQEIEDLAVNYSPDRRRQCSKGSGGSGSLIRYGVVVAASGL